MFASAILLRCQGKFVDVKNKLYNECEAVVVATKQTWIATKRVVATAGF